MRKESPRTESDKFTAFEELELDGTIGTNHVLFLYAGAVMADPMLLMLFLHQLSNTRKSD